MTGQAHLLGGALMGASYMVNTNLTVGVPFFIGSLVGSVFPDIDSGQSTISNKVPLLSFITRLFVGHRGIIHTPLFLIIISIIIQCMQTVLQFSEHILYGFICGYLCHLLQDAMTRQGIKWLYPLTNKNYRILTLRSGKGFFSGFIETALTILIVSIILFFIILLGGFLYE